MEEKRIIKGQHPEPARSSVHGAEVKAADRHSLYRHLILFCLFASVLPFIALNVTTYIITRGVLKQKSFNHLGSIRDIKKMEMEDFFFERRADAFQFSHNNVFKSAAVSYVNAFQAGGLDGAAHKEADRAYGNILVSFAEAYQYHDIMIMDMEGNVVA
ncbi:MAG: hypothetical protein V3W51_02620, partial [Candidatus Brocadiales bacterium]